MMRSRAVSAMLKVDETLAEDALTKAAQWCQAVSQPDMENGVMRAAFTSPSVTYNPCFNTFGVSVTGEVIYEASNNQGDIALRECMTRWEWAASLKARSLGVQILRFS